MIRQSIKVYSGVITTLFSLQIFAASSSIRVNVKTNERTAAAIGYSVDGKESGQAGKSYSGKGPINRTYRFGYRKSSINGTNISCGSLTLTKNSSITLITKGNKCWVKRN